MALPQMLKAVKPVKPRVQVFDQVTHRSTNLDKGGRRSAGFSVSVHTRLPQKRATHADIGRGLNFGQSAFRFPVGLGLVHRRFPMLIQHRRTIKY